MGEKGTKPLESVQTEKKACQNSCSSSENVAEQEVKEPEHFLKELATCKVQLEINESANKQATLELEFYHKTVDDLSTQLRNSEAEFDKYQEECHRAHTKTSELESENKAIARLLSGSTECQHESLSIIDELKALRKELLVSGAEVASAEKSKIVAERRAELMELAVLAEKEQSRENLMHICALNEAILSSTLAAVRADKERSASFVEVEAEMHIAKEALAQAHRKVEGMKARLDAMDELEDELLAKTIQVDYLQSELKRVKEELLLQSERAKMDFEVEMATLKAELHKSRAGVAAAEAAEARAMSAKAGLCLAVQQLAFEAEASKMESQVLKKDAEAEAMPVAASSEQASEISRLKGELEVASSRIGELRSDMEEATRRAEQAEAAKAAIEEQLRKWRAEQQQRRAAAEALANAKQRPGGGKRPISLPPLIKSRVHGATVHGESASMFDRTKLNYVPLAKILNIKL